MTEEEIFKQKVEEMLAKLEVHDFDKVILDDKDQLEFNIKAMALIIGAKNQLEESAYQFGADDYASGICKRLNDFIEKTKKQNKA